MGKHVKTLRKEIAHTSSPKEILHKTFTEMGGLDGFLEWAKKNPDKFYNRFFSIAPSSKADEVYAGGKPRAEVKPGAQPSQITVTDFSKE